MTPPKKKSYSVTATMERFKKKTREEERREGKGERGGEENHKPLSRSCRQMKARGVWTTPLVGTPQQPPFSTKF